MPSVTLQVNPEDSSDDVTIAAGDVAQAKSCKIVFDDKNKEDSLAMSNMLEMAARALRRDIPLTYA